jgi:hypothetical protein
MECIIINVVTAATGIVTRGLRKNLEAIPGKHSVDTLQKAAILGTSHVTRKVLYSESCSLSGGDHGWFKRSTGEKWSVTRYNNNNNNNKIIVIIINSNFSIPTNGNCALERTIQATYVRYIVTMRRVRVIIVAVENQ